MGLAGLDTGWRGLTWFREYRLGWRWVCRTEGFIVGQRGPGILGMEGAIAGWRALYWNGGDYYG